MSRNSPTHFKNLAAFAARFLGKSDHFGTLCIKGLNHWLPLYHSAKVNIYIIQYSIYYNILVIIPRTKHFAFPFFGGFQLISLSSIFIEFLKLLAKHHGCGC